MIRSTVPEMVLLFSAINKKTDHLRVHESQALLLPNTAESVHPLESQRSILAVAGAASCVLSPSVVSTDSVTPWALACQASLFMGFPRQEH